MKHYRTLLFDIDDTLLDFRAAEQAALALLFAEQNMQLTDEIKERYKQINQQLWSEFEEGRITREEVVNSRFSLLFQEYGYSVDGTVLEAKYRGYLEEGHQLIEDALEIVTGLQPNYDLYIVTNGVSKTQYKRLLDSKLHPFFKGIFVSEDTGFQKPMKEFFDYVFARIPHFNAEEALIIGDSLNADIKGGQQAGIDTCWFNPGMKPNKAGIEPTYQIQALAELSQILVREKEPV
ncbi:YjjG family noncanonical pyrimidine nucleotidase [Domibacillus sp. DTU_2020_1001157_1_SI_ALB_TIR_016]|uniref:YjjG family noncanonical pyrimidine nucleotidase n=1 Tax=Domibacillus sp. DTU_2020_1001157_1_SI_ALB_TIR_016 TaxID=3077789 RepID=UPI0028E8D0E6|nr:YjjG family noncanonical pyrimidine nucleotidase [Domibacillus sp. DTU_2020_1001157_1_SI_ALB_TIR_016]WNS80702.1 YjjG family noncanonical pyrimidine nucleotidase [Domibacillus sp. DTU_2020_1001157_1_SI_ALB_TIR_016]